MKWTNNPNNEWNKLFSKKMPRVMRGMLRGDLTGLHGDFVGEIVRVNINTIIVLFKETDILVNRCYSWSIKKESSIFPRLSTEEALRVLNKDERKNLVRGLFGYFYK